MGYKKYRDYKLLYKVFKHKEYKKYKHWGIFGNVLLDPLTKSNKNQDIFIMDRNSVNAFLEYQILSNNDYKAAYVDFYFSNHDYKKALNENKGVICLHNSWTPKRFKDMNENDFLKSDITLSKMLRHILNESTAT